MTCPIPSNNKAAWLQPYLKFFSLGVTTQLLQSHKARDFPCPLLRHRNVSFMRHFLNFQFSNLWSSPGSKLTHVSPHTTPSASVHATCFYLSIRLPPRVRNSRHATHVGSTSPKAAKTQLDRLLSCDAMSSAHVSGSTYCNARKTGPYPHENFFRRVLPTGRNVSFRFLGISKANETVEIRGDTEISHHVSVSCQSVTMSLPSFSCTCQTPNSFSLSI